MLFHTLPSVFLESPKQCPEACSQSCGSSTSGSLSGVSIFGAFPLMWHSFYPKAYEACSTDRDRQLLLSDIRVETEESERVRRVGPDLSRRIHLFLVSSNPELVLDWSA